MKNRIDIDCDSSTNSIILMGDKRLVSEAESLCKNLDSMPVEQLSKNKARLIKEKGFITKTYGLELKDYDNLERELESIIERKNSAEVSSNENSNDKEYFLINKEKKSRYCTHEARKICCY